MIEARRPLYRYCVYTLLLVAIVSFGCGKKKVSPPPPPPPPPEQPKPQPTVTLSANPTTIQKGDSSTLSWTSTNATQLTIAPNVGAVSAEGSAKVSPSDSTDYTITAIGPGGSVTATARVTATAPPPPPPPAPQENPSDIFNREHQDAFFDLNKADIRPDARQALQKTADLLSKYPQVRVTIEGHCDERGSTEYNLVLGDRRANAAKQYLVALGISADRLTTVSVGKEKPFCTDENETCWQQNRRAHFVAAQ